MPKKRWIPTYYIDLRISVPSPAGGDPRPAWDAAHGAVAGLRAALPPGAGAEITHTGTGKMEAPEAKGPLETLMLVTGAAPGATNSEINPDLSTATTEHRKEIGHQASEVNGLTPENATEEISPAHDDAMEIPPKLDRRVPRREEG